MSDKGKKSGQDKKSGIDADAVRELAALLTETGLTEIEIEHNGAKIRVSRGAVAASAPCRRRQRASRRPAGPAPAPPPRGPLAGAVPSPMVGTIYPSPEPGKPAFVKIGQTVKEGERCSSWKR